MKRNIVICCRSMLEALIDKRIVLDAIRHTTGIDTGGGYLRSISFCPFCGTKMPFPAEEE